MGKYYGYSHKPTAMNDWIRLTCKPPNEGLLVSDLDFIFYDYKKNEMMLVEHKTFGAKMKEWQSKLFKKLDFALKNMANIDEIGGFKYNGFYLIETDTDNPETASSIQINGLKVTKQQLIDFLDFKISFFDINPTAL